MNQTSTKHPKALYVLFFAEMWERFSFYGMKALLMVYMVTQMKYPDEQASLILGSYLALVYSLPMLGGLLADKFLGYRKAVIWGGIVMAIGHFVLAIPNDISFFFGLGFIIVGNGFFKPNISSMVGKLYKEGDPKRDAGFTLFYLGINIGAAMGGLICGIIGQKISWHLGFGIAGIFMILGLFVFIKWQDILGEVGLPTNIEIIKKRVLGFLTFEQLIYVGSFLLVPCFVLMIIFNGIMLSIMISLSVFAFAFLLYTAYSLKGSEGYKLLAATVMIIFSVLFWTFYEQGGGSLNLFALRNVDMVLFGYEMPSTAVNNFINPAFIVIFGLLFTLLWKFLNDRKIEPSTPLKFGFGLLQLALGFYVFYLGAMNASSDGLVSLSYFTLGYLFLSTGELCLSPIGLSMVTKLSPLHIVGLVMGIWFLASGLGQYFAGVVGTWMAIPNTNGTEALPKVQSLLIYAGVFKKIAWITLISGILMTAISPIVKKWMGDVR